MIYNTHNDPDRGLRSDHKYDTSDLSRMRPQIHAATPAITPPPVRRANEKSIKHLSLISLCKSADPSPGVRRPFAPLHAACQEEGKKTMEMFKGS